MNSGPGFQPGGKPLGEPGGKPLGDGQSDSSGGHKGRRGKDKTGSKHNDWWGKGYGNDWSGRPHRQQNRQGKPDRIDKMADSIAALTDVVGKLTTASINSQGSQAQGSTGSAGGSSSKKTAGSNPAGQKYANAKRSLQKKRSALLRLLGFENVDSTFDWRVQFPNDSEFTRRRIALARTEHPETYARLVKGIRSAEAKVIAAKIDPTNTTEQPLQVLPKIFDEEEPAKPEAAAQGDKKEEEA